MPSRPPKEVLLKDTILQAAEAAGNKEGMLGYLTVQASANPVAFMTWTPTSPQFTATKPRGSNGP